MFGFDPFQVRYAGNEFKRLLEAVAEGAEAAKNVSSNVLYCHASTSLTDDDFSPLQLLY